MGLGTFTFWVWVWVFFFFLLCDAIPLFFFKKKIRFVRLLARSFPFDLGFSVNGGCNYYITLALYLFGFLFFRYLLVFSVGIISIF